MQTSFTIARNLGGDPIIRRLFHRRTSEDEIRESLPDLYPRLWRFALALTGQAHHADDLAQAAALRAIEKADKYQADTQLDAWVFTIARRIWLNEMRAAKVRNEGNLVSLDAIELPDPRSGPETNIFHREVFNNVMALPEAQRVTVLLVYVEGYAYKEAADMLDIPIGTVMSRLSAARKRIQEQHMPQEARQS